MHILQWNNKSSTREVIPVGIECITEALLHYLRLFPSVTSYQLQVVQNPARERDPHKTCLENCSVLKLHIKRVFEC